LYYATARNIVIIGLCFVNHIVISTQKTIDGVLCCRAMPAVRKGVKIRFVIVDGLAGIEDGIVITSIVDRLLRGSDHFGRPGRLHDDTVVHFSGLDGCIAVFRIRNGLG
jgi:hypothetical protein